MTPMEVFQQKMRQDIKESPYDGKGLVFGEATTQPKVCMIGEAPGGDEEMQGHPFVGKAGKNLSEFLQKVGLQREEIYISNVVKLRPIRFSPKTGKPINRPPSREEIGFFLPYLLEELEIVQPKIIVTLGNVPLKAVTGEKKAVIGDYHGRLGRTPKGLGLFPLYHPAAIIYNRGLTEVYYEDLERLKEFL